MGVLQTLFHQPSRTYSGGEQGQNDASGDAEATAATKSVDGDEEQQQQQQEQQQQQRAARRSQYYSAAADPRLRKEWDRILATDRHRRRTRTPLSAGAGAVPSATVGLATGKTLSKDKEEEDSDQFFTPLSSPQASPQIKAAALSLDNSLALEAHAPAPIRSLSLTSSTSTSTSTYTSMSISRQQSSSSSLSPQGTSVSNASVNLNYASSITSTSDDSYTNYSWSARGPRSDQTHFTTTSTSSCHSRHSKQYSEPPYAPASQIVPTPDWAKDIRWLVPPEEMQSRYPSKRSNTISAPSTASLSSLGSRLSSRSSTRASTSGSGRSKTEPTRLRGKRRMSEIQEEVEDDTTTPSHEEEVEANRQASLSSFGVLGVQRRKSNSSQSKNQPRRRGPSAHSEASSSSSAPTAELPVLLPHAEPGTYTSIVFPRTNYQPSKHPDRITTNVDVIHSGVASTTMSTICVTKHAAESLDRSRRFSLPGRILSPRNSSDGMTPKHLTPDENPLVALSSHTPSPTKVQANQVLVKVCCVALEGLDVFLVREKGKTADGYGFVPGRGFCGKIVEAGYNISDFKRGDWVIGQLDLSKSGALSEFAVVDKRRVHRTQPPTSSLTAEHLAVLAVSGVAAHRAVSTLPGPLDRSRILVLQAHDGAGALVAQELVSAGARVTVQVADESKLAKLRGIKLEATKVGTPIEVLRALEGAPTEGEAYDAIIDTVGGKEIWEECKKLFGSEGQFTTLVGDSFDSCLSRNAHLKSNMRSLKSAFRKSDRRSIQYEWVSPNAEVDHEGTDIRHSLEAVYDLAVQGHIRPRIEDAMQVPFERAPEILNRTRMDGAASYLLAGGVAVVRLQ